MAFNCDKCQASSAVDTDGPILCLKCMKPQEYTGEQAKKALSVVEAILPSIGPPTPNRTVSVDADTLVTF